MNVTKILTSLLCILGSFSLSAAVVISDIDDTLRMSETISPKESLRQFVQGKDSAYPGMLRFFEDLKHSTLSFYYISNSYVEIYDAPVWLKQQGFPNGEVFQRKNLHNRMVSSNVHSNHKKDKLNEIYDSNNDIKNQNVILFGDNVSDDEKIYLDFCNQKKLKCSIFIRDVKLKGINLSPFRPEEVAANVFRYTDEFDLLTNTASILNDLLSPGTINMILASGHHPVNLNSFEYAKKEALKAKCAKRTKIFCKMAVEKEFIQSVRSSQKNKSARLFL